MTGMARYDRSVGPMEHDECHLTRIVSPSFPKPALAVGVREKRENLGDVRKGHCLRWRLQTPVGTSATTGPIVDSPGRRPK